MTLIAHTDFNRVLFPFKYLRPGMPDAEIFYRFCTRAFLVCLVVVSAMLVWLNFLGKAEEQFVRDAFKIIPLANFATLAPLLLLSVGEFFRAIDYRQYRPFHWNPDARLRRTAPMVRASVAGIAISLLALLLPQGLFLLLIDEYHAIKPTYIVTLIFAAMVVYVSPIVSNVMLISLTALITFAMKTIFKN